VAALGLFVVFLEFWVVAWELVVGLKKHSGKSGLDQ